MEYLGLAIFATVVLAVLVYPTKPKPQKSEVEFAVFEDWIPLTSHENTKDVSSLFVSDR